jgi:hypothetical protein
MSNSASSYGTLISHGNMESKHCPDPYGRAQKSGKHELVVGDGGTKFVLRSNPGITFGFFDAKNGGFRKTRKQDQ